MEIHTEKEMTLADCLPISSQDNFRPGTEEETSSPLVSKPMISMPTEDVRPELRSISKFSST